MRIAITATFLKKEHPEGHGRFVKAVFSRLVRNHPEHEFIFLFDRSADPASVSVPNVIPLAVPLPASSPLLARYWYDIKAPLALKRYAPDLWVQPYGLVSLTTTIPQLLIAKDLSLDPGSVSWYRRGFNKIYTGRFLRKAARIATVSEHSKQAIAERHKLSPGKIGVVYSAAGEQFKPISWQEKQEVKEQYTGGTEYFLCAEDIYTRNNLVNLLRAFSLFKKWQHSNMKLVLVKSFTSQKELQEKLKTYKYRNDVLLAGGLSEDERAKLTAAAYASVYPSFFAEFGMPVAEAMQSGVPVITSDTGSMAETGGEAVLYTDPNDPDAVAKHMLSLYRDETFRSRMIDAGLLQVSRFNWDTTTELLWENMMSIVDSRYPSQYFQ